MYVEQTKKQKIIPYWCLQELNQEQYSHSSIWAYESYISCIWELYYDLSTNNQAIL